jgi:hypothetical protein
MRRIPWIIATLLMAGVFACTEDGAAQETTGDITTTGATSITLTAATTGEEFTTSGSSTTVDATTTSGTSTTSGDLSTSGELASSSADDSTGPIPGSLACEGTVWACGDGIDNDGDGKIDDADFECISPCDNDEGSFQTDLPGQAEDCKNDCFWDADSGAGQDKCEYDLKCDSENPGADIKCVFDEVCPAKTPPACLDACVKYIPNGCDCFGCCHVTTPDGIVDYYLDSSDECALDNLAACNQCTFQEQCANPCEGCEVCFGMDAPPEGCDPDEGDQCPEGVQACTAGEHECPEDEYCQTGCCKPLVIP